MLHDSGLPAHRDYYKEAKGHDAVLAKILAKPLLHEPGTQVEYSDLGFILLGKFIERLTGQTLEQFAKAHIFAPLEMSDTMYNPPAALRARIAPTELDTDFRKRLLRGEVHDENAFALGGVSGNAGLFGTAGDLAAFAQMLLNGGIYAHHRLLSTIEILRVLNHEDQRVALAVQRVLPQIARAVDAIVMHSRAAGG